MFREVAEFVAVLACGLFAGAALYVSLVEHPARMECGVETAITVFGPSYRRATVLQVTLAALGLLSSLVACCRTDAELRDPVHPGRHPADEQAIDQSCIGPSLGKCKQAAFTLGSFSRSEDRDQLPGSNAFFVFVDLRADFGLGALTVEGKSS
jgi:hypothetical protein